MRYLLFLILTFFVIQIHAQTNTYPYPSDDNIGIGTTSPLHRLSIAGQGNYNNSSAAAISLHSTFSDRVFQFHADDNGGFQIADRTNGKTLFWIKPNNDFHLLGGKVGIGTSTPTCQFEIREDFNGITKLKVWNSDNNDESRSQVQVGNEGYAVSLSSHLSNYQAVQGWNSSGILSTDSRLSNGLVIRTSSGNIRFQPNGITDKVVFKPNGNVGIGTTNPTHTLTVNGKIKAEEIIVADVDGADFVFESDYQLPSLQETEDFIKANKHLPGVPSAKQMQEEGMTIGEMNILLLQKIEELTLYTLDQQKELEAKSWQLEDQEALLQELLQRIEKLEEK